MSLARRIASIAAECMAPGRVPGSPVRVLPPSALAGLNPAGQKTAMLYAFGDSAWNESPSGNVPSYDTSSPVAVENGAAATVSASEIRRLLSSDDAWYPR